MERQHLSQTKNSIASPPSQTNTIARSSTHPIVELQGAIGNRAVNKLLANQPTLQAKPMFGGLSHELVIQPKLTIGAVGDKYEQEADRVAASVVQRIHSPQNQVIQREEMPEGDEKLQMMPMIQRADRWNGGIAAPLNLESSIDREKGRGQSIPQSLCQPMENAFGADFSGVKVHTDDRSHQLNRSIQSRAFSTGQDIFFRHGEYNPGARQKQELLAHELTHIVQQNGSAVSRRQRQSDSTSSNSLPKIDRNGAKNVIQCKPINVKARWLTHLVEVQQGSLFNGEEREELEGGSQLVIETEDIIESRRGPNQEIEENRKGDEMANQLHPWYRVLEIQDGFLSQDVREKNYYIRGDTTNIAESHIEAMSQLLHVPKMKWQGSAAPSFSDWMNSKVEEPINANCWNAVLYAAYQANLVDKEYIKMANQGGLGVMGPRLSRAIASNPRGSVLKDFNKQFGKREKEFVENAGKAAPFIPRGDVIVLGQEGFHVMLSLGGGNVLELDSQAVRSIPNPNFDPNFKNNKKKLISETGKLERKQKFSKLTEKEADELTKLTIQSKEREEKKVNQNLLFPTNENEVRELKLMEQRFMQLEKLENMKGIFWGPLPSYSLLASLSEN
jgi:Domain of unknown function (DUF4157)